MPCLMELTLSLNRNEIKLHRLLKGVSPDSMLGLAITNALAKNNTTSFCELLQFIKSQGEDNPEEMMKVIGVEAWELINDFSLNNNRKWNQ